MAQFDMPLAHLEHYRPDVACPPDFVDFWTTTFLEARGRDQPVQLDRVASGLTEIVVDDVTFAGFAGDPIKAWLKRPARFDPAEPLPAVVQFVGYGGGRGLPHEDLAWAAAGFANLVMDTRGQGSSWGGGGQTADPQGRSASVPGFLTAGIDRPQDHFYRRFFTDAARAVDAIRALPGIDGNRVVVAGGSQGGGAAIAAASVLGMVGEPVAAALPDVPFLCHLRRAVEVTDSMPYREITQYLSVHRDAATQERVWHTLSYLDGVNLARHATVPALFSVGLMDFTCPPSCVYAAFNAWGAAASGQPVEKRIDVYPYNEHEGGGGYRFPEQLAWVRSKAW